MIIKEVVLTPSFRKDFYDLDSKLQGKVREILRSIEYGENLEGVVHIPLKGDLAGFTSVHFNNNFHRLIYRTYKNKIKVIVLMVGSRINDGDIYDRFRELKDKRKL